MDTPDPVLDSLRAAVESAPADIPLRLHLAELLLGRGVREEAVGHIATALAAEPANQAAAALMARALGAPAPPKPAEEPFNWSAAESQLADVVPPKFVEEPVSGEADTEQLMLDVERSSVRLDDVGGMAEVKKRLNAAFLAPMRNPKLRELYGKSLRGGLLLYGPPGCGKTFLAKAVAGELGAKFLSVGLNEVLDMWLGKSERNVHDVFARARLNAPCVLFFDELDGVGQKRSQLRGGGVRNVVNQLLAELDGVSEGNDGVFVLAATNTPWDVDVALRRPGRFDRTVLVLPPDEPARRAIFEYHLRDRPVAGINLSALAKRTEGMSGADLAHICETAAERALISSVESGEVRMIGMPDLLAAVGEVAPSTGAWFATARNVAMYANQDGTYDDLLAYLKRNRLL
ncbi:ATP-binding protein [Amycolatopsis anabasis]|uniref:ATP-binding protein n=1 Tax=Amycolatopsis anabasis TaxID=1840409 RepID=UPI00131B7996|nr:ATP-binding protein [Amycolatopsis anabasis]